jgi:hypothetical protein
MNSLIDKGWQSRKFKIKASGTGAFGDNPEERGVRPVRRNDKG